MKSRLLVILFALITIPTIANAQLSRSQARNLLRRAAGFELGGSAVRVKNVSDISPSAAEITADVRTVFKFEKDARGNWRVVEIRTAQDRWEQIEVFSNLVANECRAPDPPSRGSVTVDPSNRRARCLLGSLFAISVPSDAVRIQSVSALGIPMSSEPSAVVSAWISVNARAVRDKGGWRISELRTGERNWTTVEALIDILNQQKQRQARADLEAMAKALEKYRMERGIYVASDSQAVLIDHLSPKYLLPVLRLDPWNQPYGYEGTHNHFTLTSRGPDKKPNTSDDISLSGPTSRSMNSH